MLSKEAPQEAPAWQHNGIEATYQELIDAQFNAARKIRGHLLELGQALEDKSPMRLSYKVGRMTKQDLVLDIEEGTLTHEVWETWTFAPDVPSYGRNSYGSNIEIERLKEPLLSQSTPLPFEKHPSIWIESGRSFANKIHTKIEAQTPKPI